MPWNSWSYSTYNLVLTNKAEKLDLSDRRIDDRLAYQVAQALPRNKYTQRLYLNKNSIGRIGAARIAESLLKTPPLTLLDLNDNRLGDEGASAFAAILPRLSNLTWLCLGGNGITDVGAKLLANSIASNTTLEVLYLAYNLISGEGSVAFSEALRTNSTLQSLSLWRNPVDDRGARSFIDTLQRKNSSLKELYLEDSNISEELWDEIKAILKTREFGSPKELFTKQAKGPDDVEIGMLTNMWSIQDTIDRYPCSQTPFVFFSQTNTDKARELIARPTYWFLQNVLRVEAFLDERDSAMGKDKHEVMLKNAFHCTHAVVILSPTFREREFCVKELNTFMYRMFQLQHDITIIPCLWGGVKKEELQTSYAKKVADLIRLEQDEDDNDEADFLIYHLWPKLIKIFPQHAPQTTGELEDCLLTFWKTVEQTKGKIPNRFKYFVKYKEVSKL